jgi:hypothetical protein
MIRSNNPAERRADLIQAAKVNGAEPGLQAVATEYEQELRQRVADGKASDEDMQTLANLNARSPKPPTP